MHSGGPSQVVLQETVYKQRLLQLAQARPTMPAFTSIVTLTAAHTLLQLDPEEVGHDLRGMRI